ncbi:MAG: alpha-isopropylmalate synthase regulatory domain-containing protein, partial [Acidimicrobiales bacterium]
MRGDAAEDRGGLELVGEFVLVVGDLASVDPGIGPVDAVFKAIGELVDRPVKLTNYVVTKIEGGSG